MFFLGRFLVEDTGLILGIQNGGGLLVRNFSQVGFGFGGKVLVFRGSRMGNPMVEETLELYLESGRCVHI